MMDMHTLQIEKVSAGYSNRPIFEDIEMSVQSGQLTSIQGRNGSGKSTLLRAFAGLTPLLDGSISIDGQSISTMSAIERSTHIGAVWTDRTRIQGITVRELVNMGAYNGAWIITGLSKEQHVEHTLAILQLTALAEKSTAEISDGQLQQAMIARALAQCAHFLVLDEPTTFLDYVAKKELMQSLQLLARKTKIGIIFSSHDLDIIQAFADTTYELSEGKLMQLIKA